MFPVVVVALLVNLAVGLFITIYPEKTSYYKQGQVDCANGKMQYQLNKHEDGSTSWEKKER